MTTDTTAVEHPVAKLASVGAVWLWGMTWGEMASMFAALYTLLMIFDWFWKRFGKPLFIRQGWIKGPPHAFMDTTGRMPLDEKDQQGLR